MTTEKKKKKSSAFAKLKLVDKPDLEDTMERKVENISVVFSLLNDKDVFKKFYAKYLAKRLIRGILNSFRLYFCFLTCTHV